MENVESASGMMQHLQSKYIAREEEDRVPSNENAAGEWDQEEVQRTAPPRRELGFLEGLKFICSSTSKVAQNEFPTHIFGIPTSFCMGWDEDDATSKGSYDEDFDEYYDEMEYELGFAPRGRDFLSDLSTIMEATAEITRADTNSTIETEATSKSKKNNVVLVGVQKRGMNEEKRQTKAKDSKGPAEGLYLTAASKANDNILANSTSSQADSTGVADPSVVLNRSASKSPNLVNKMPFIIEEDRESVLRALSLDSDGEPMEGQYNVNGNLEVAKRSFGKAFSQSSSSGSSSHETDETGQRSGLSQEPSQQLGKHLSKSLSSARSRDSLRSRSGSKSLFMSASKLFASTDSRGDRSSARSENCSDSLLGSRETRSGTSGEESFNSDVHSQNELLHDTAQELIRPNLGVQPNTTVESEQGKKVDTPRPKGRAKGNSHKSGNRKKTRFFGKKKSQDSMSSA